MFLKFRCRLGLESLCAEASDSITWRRFCRIPLGRCRIRRRLMKLTHSVRLAAVQRCNEAMLAKAAGRSCCGRRGGGPAQRSANVSYPTDSGLLAKAIRRI